MRDTLLLATPPLVGSGMFQSDWLGPLLKGPAQARFWRRRRRRRRPDQGDDRAPGRLQDHQNHLQGPAAHRLQWPWEQRLTILTTTSRPTSRPDRPSSHTSSTVRLFQRLGCLAEPCPGEDLDLGKAVEIGRQYEHSQNQIKVMRGEEVLSVRAKIKEKTHNSVPKTASRSPMPQGQGRKGQNFYRQDTTDRTQECDRCGRKHIKDQCPAKGTDCANKEYDGS